mmetsp:Transcript_29116/g.32334  ORF Transcript_29116/g.32334 Transcript_29116/m.32334 type:complete len:94 (+) Transcript_29116:68-349(+)
MATIDLYFATVSSSQVIKKRQQKIQMVLEGKKIPINIIDIAKGTADKEKMRELAGDPKALPPQICNGDQYCGNFEAFDNACEDEQLMQFLKLA